jgi:bis(5'-nucleosidyl)-tetraphosphatase
MKNERSAGAIVFRKEGDEIFFLLLHYERQNDEKKDHTYWDFPKGHVEEGETEVHTVFREVEEESGLKDIKIIEGFREKIKYFFNYKGVLINKEVIFFLCETKTKEIKISEEHIGFEWLRFKEAEQIITFKNSKDILTKAKEFLSHRKKLTDW